MLKNFLLKKLRKLSVSDNISEAKKTSINAWLKLFDLRETVRAIGDKTSEFDEETNKSLIKDLEAIEVALSKYLR